MMNVIRARVWLSLALVGSFAVGCGGDDAPTLECGAGTVELDGACLPTESVCTDGSVYQPETRSCAAQCMEGTTRRGAMCIPAIECGPGTMQMGDECVADGSIYCGGNTIFDAELGECVPDPDAICEGDLVYVAESASCVDPDELLEGMADVRELAEPNDPAFNDAAMAQTVDISSGAASFYGCAEPADFDMDGEIDIDRDLFAITVTAPTLLEVRTQGIRGLNAGLAVVSADEDLAGDGWQRFVVSLSGSGATRQVFLPKAGEYVLIATDTRSLLTGLPAGGPNQCYFVQLALQDLPAPTAITPGTPVTGTFGTPTFYSFDASEGQLMFSELSELNRAGLPLDRDSLVSASVISVTNLYRSSAVEEEGVTSDVAFGLRAAETVWVVVDYVFDISPSSTRFSLELTNADVVPLPTDGSSVDVVHDDDFFRFAYFEATAGDVVRIQAQTPTSDLLFGTAVFQPSGTGFGLCPTATCAAIDSYVQVAESGLYYIRFYNLTGTASETYPLEATLTHITPSALTRGTAGAADLSDATRAFFTSDLSTADWVEWSAAALVNVDTVRLQLYPLGEFGVLDVSQVAADNTTLTATTTRERIVRGADLRYLVSVTDAAGAAGDETFELLVDDVPFVDLGTIVPGTDVSRTAETIADGGPNRYLSEATPFSLMTIAVTNVDATVDPLIAALNRLGAATGIADDELAGGDETLEQRVNAEGWVGFIVVDFETGGEYDLTVSVVPPPYSIAFGTLPFASVCPSGGNGGTVLTFTPNPDEGWSEIIDLGAEGAFPFLFFGNGVSDMRVSSNGFLTFRIPAPASPVLGAASRDIIAPLAANLITNEACTYRDGDRYTVEIRGPLATDAAQVARMQVVLHTSGRIDLIYAAEQTIRTGNFAGLINDDASIAMGLLTLPEPGTSVTYTPTL